MPIDIEELIARYGSPMYLYDLAVVRQRAERLKAAFDYDDLHLLYAVKANPCPPLVRTIIEAGYGIDAVSPGEVTLAQRLGLEAADILYTENNMTEAEMHYATGAGILINCGSLYRLERLGRSGGKRASVRINPDITDGEHAHVLTAGPLTKFGVHHSQVDELQRIQAETDIKIVGVHMHIGSNILDVDVYLEAMQVILDVARQLEHLEFIDFGGGLGVPYKPDDQPLDVEALGSRASQLMRDFCKDYGRPLRMIIEPGRYLVAECGTLYTSVTAIKTNPGYDDQPPRTFVGCDTGFNHLLRPCLYDSYHPIGNATRPVAEPSVVDVVGNICESGDVFARQRAVPTPRVGDILAFGCAGAYGMSMASTYNLRPLPPELVVDGDEITVVRRRRRLDELLDDWVWPEPETGDDG